MNGSLGPVKEFGTDIVTKLPYIQWYTGDWLKDPLVSMCTPSTRGIWFDMLCAMHEAGRSGSLRGTTEQLARIARCSTTDLAQALTEIQITEVAVVAHDRNGIVTVTNRRMARESKDREKAANRQKRHRARDDTSDTVTHVSRLGHAGSSDVRRQTSYSERSFSASTSSLTSRSSTDKNGRSDVDAHRFELSEEQIGQAVIRFERAKRIAKPATKDPQRAADLDLLAKAAILSVTTFSEDWLVDSCEATRLNKKDGPACRYLHGVLKEKAKLNGFDLNRCLAKTLVPTTFFDEVIESGDE